MVVATMTHSTIRRTEREFAAVKLSSRAIAELGGFIHNLVKGREDVVRELDLCDRRASRGSVADCKSSDTLIEYAIESNKLSVHSKQAHIWSFLSLPVHKAAS